MSDKRAAHIDVGHSLVIEMANNADAIGLTPIHYFAAQMIFTAKSKYQSYELLARVDCLKSGRF